MSKLFDTDLILQISRYLSPAHNQPAYAKIISGRMLEEVVELHLESGGNASSAMGHVMDAVTNESFKVKAKLGSDGPKLQSYPSRIKNEFNQDEVLSELADLHMMFVLNLLNLLHKKTFKKDDLEYLESLVAARVRTKLAKLIIAEEEDRLIMTEDGTYYINKGI